MNRRAFFQRLGVAAAVAPVQALLPAASAPAPLLFHRDAFAMACPMVQRFDVLIGWGRLRPDLVVRLSEFEDLGC